MLTPARTWAVTEQAASADVATHPPLRRWVRITTFLSVVAPTAGLAAAIGFLWHRGQASWGIGWPEVIVLLSMYALAGFGVTIGYHRLLTHKAFQTPRAVRLLLAILGSSAGQGMAIRWVAVHRRHHQQADCEGDPHSPHHHGVGLWGSIRGFWHAHIGWAFQVDKAQLARSVPDLLADRGLLMVDQLYFLWVALGMLIPAVALAILMRSWHGFWAGLIWGGVVRIGLMQHVTWSVNSVCHIWGGRPFHSDDHSTNNLPVAVLSLGEGWHNNHHAFPTSARHGLRWWQFDPSYLIIATMRRVGLAWDVRLPSAAAMAAKAQAA